MICIAHTYAYKEHAISVRDKNKTWTTYEEGKDEQNYWWQIKDKYRKYKEESGDKSRDSEEEDEEGYKRKGWPG